MSPAPARSPLPEAAVALLRAVEGVLRAILAAVLGDVSELKPRHPVRRLHARMERLIPRYVALLAAALADGAAKLAAQERETRAAGVTRSVGRRAGGSAAREGHSVPVAVGECAPCPAGTLRAASVVPRGSPAAPTGRPPAWRPPPWRFFAKSGLAAAGFAR